MTYEAGGASLNYKLMFSAPGLHEVFTETFGVETGGAFSLEIVQQPGGASGGLPFSTQPTLCNS